jgi:hypothetical protein
MKWNQGYNLVIASEAIDFIASDNRRFDGPEILNRLVDELLWHGREEDPLHGSDEDIKAVVVYGPYSIALASMLYGGDEFL